jgi:hypothetical protein
MTSRMRDYGVAAPKRRPNVRFCRSRSCSRQWARAMDPIGRGHAGSKTLWICRCAWTTLPRRPQLHRANISKHCLMKTERELRLGRRTSEVTRSRMVRRRSLDGPAPHVKCVARRCTQWRAPLGSSTNTQAPSRRGSYAKSPCRSSSSLRVLRRQGAAKHKRR